MAPANPRKRRNADSEVMSTADPLPGRTRSESVVSSASSSRASSVSSTRSTIRYPGTATLQVPETEIPKGYAVGVEPNPEPNPEPVRGCSSEREPKVDLVTPKAPVKGKEATSCTHGQSELSYRVFGAMPAPAPIFESRRPEDSSLDVNHTQQDPDKEGSKKYKRIAQDAQRKLVELQEEIAYLKATYQETQEAPIVPQPAAAGICQDRPFPTVEANNPFQSNKACDQDFEYRPSRPLDTAPRGPELPLREENHRPTIPHSTAPYQPPFNDHASHVASAPIDSVANWRPRGSHPNSQLKGEDVDEYAPWRYAIDAKIEDDFPMYPTERSKIRYALSRMDKPIFDIMQTFVFEDMTRTFADLMDEVEHYMGVHRLADAALRELQSTTQKPGETVTQYYHRLLVLWGRASVPERERVKKFKTSLRQGLANYLWYKDHGTVREALDDARRLEEAKAEIDFQHPQQPRNRGGSAGNSNSSSNNQLGNKNTQKGNNSNANNTKAGGKNPPPPGNGSNRRFPPTATKPEEWRGEWHEPERFPLKLTNEMREMLQRQGRCWACRGSGHRSGDSCCPRHRSNGKALNEISAESIAAELSDSELEN